MRQFQGILHELKAVVAKHRPGDHLEPPAVLPSLKIDGHRLSYVQAGEDHPERDRPVVVFLHGFGGFFMDWPRVMMPVARHTRVYALDLPGWGFSDPNPHSHTLEDEVHVIREFISRLRLKRVILCGISYGAGVAWAAAAARTSQVERVVLLNPMPTNPLQYMKSPLYRAIFALNSSMPVSLIGHRALAKSHYKLICRESLLNDRLLDTFYLDLAYMVIKQPKIPRILHAHAKGARGVDWADWGHRLAGIQMPVSILQAREDKIFSLASARHLHRLIPNSELIEVEKCGHAMVFDQHRRVSDHLIDLLGVREKASEAPTG